jgi:hypothetical protein
MNLFYIRKQGLKGLAAPFPCTPNPRPSSSAPLRTVPLDDSEHLLHNQHASVASLRLLFTFERNAVRLPSGISVHLHRNTQRRSQ